MHSRAAKLLRTLSKKRSASTSQARQAAVHANLIAVTISILLQLISHKIKYFILFHHPDRLVFIALLVLSKTTAHARSIAYYKVNLYLEAAILKATLNSLEPGASEEAITSAKKANQKSASLPEVFQTSLNIFINQYITSLLAFYQAGYNKLVAYSISSRMLAIPLLLQQQSQNQISSVTSNQRQKENKL